MYIILKYESFNTDQIVSMNIERTKQNTLVLNLETTKNTIKLYEHDNSDEYYVMLIIKAIYDCIINKALKVGYPSMNLSKYEDMNKFKKYINSYNELISSDDNTLSMINERKELMNKLKTCRESSELKELMDKLTKINTEVNKKEVEVYNRVVEEIRFDIREGEF